LAGPDQIFPGGGTVNLTCDIRNYWFLVIISSPPIAGGEIFSDSTSTSSIFIVPMLVILKMDHKLCWYKDDVLITFVNCAILDFDGIDDNVTFKNNYSLILARSV
jgi:hypothetical protein